MTIPATSIDKNRTPPRRIEKLQASNLVLLNRLERISERLSSTLERLDGSYDLPTEPQDKESSSNGSLVRLEEIQTKTLKVCVSIETYLGSLETLI